MDPTVEQLARYIMQELGRGVPEQSLRASLMQHGWTSAWIDAAFVAVRWSSAQQQVRTSLGERAPAPAMPTDTASQLPTSAFQPSSSQLPLLQPQRHRKWPKILAIVAVLIVVLGIAAMLVVPRIMRPAQERAARDNARRDDLAQLLGELSDYYAANSKYPTLSELNDPAFRAKQHFKDDVIKDPQWSTADTACTKSGGVILADAVQPHCYAYKTSTSQGAPCNNTDATCNRMTIIILLEKGNKTTQVTFDRDSELE